MRITVVLMFMIFALSARAQWECRSHLLSNLKPVKSFSALRWGGELEGSGGYLTNSFIANGMVFLGAELSVRNHTFYAEGGEKYWYNRNLDQGYSFSKLLPGLRELSYSYGSPGFQIKAGLQQMTIGDYFLVNERAWGLSVFKPMGDFKLLLSGATVTKQFARNGIFCSNSYLYDIVTSRSYPLGNAMGETNFAAISLTKIPGKKQTAQASGDDKFGSFEPVSTQKSGWDALECSYGMTLYAEFGSYYTVPRWYGTLQSQLKTDHLGNLKAEGVYQSMTDSRAVLFFLQYEKDWEWSTGDRTSVRLTGLEKLDLDEGTQAMPAFANLFMGEVFRLDIIDLPLVNVSLRHQLPNQQLSVKLSYSRQIEGANMQELDCSIGKFFFDKHVRMTLLSGLMHSDELSDWSKLARLEMRVFF